MCGITFLYNNSGKDGSGSVSQNETRIRRMVNAILHRGPDEQNVMVRGSMALGHARLSIVDVKGGGQPMQSDDGRFAIVYNGEIYNYQALRHQLEQQQVTFKTQSDTEVILQLFIRDGEACVNSLRGMFGFAVHDKLTGNFFVARDRLGIKPMFYYWDGEVFAGGSEIKSIFASGLVEPVFNYQSIANYLKYQFSVAPNTPFQSIYELEPGYTLSFNVGTAPVIKPYWDLQFPEADDYESMDESSWLQRFEAALDDSAISHTIGEVPIGAYLSGGIDSATTTYLLGKHYNNNVQTYTIRFTNLDNDESDISSNIARHLKVPNTELIVDDDRPGGYLKILEQVIYHLEQPQRVAVDIPHFMLSGLVQSNHYKVVYTGDGADEILAGYDCYRQDAIRTWGNALGDSGQRRSYYYNEFGGNFSQPYLRMLSGLHQAEHQAEVIKKFGCYPSWFDNWQLLGPIGRSLINADLLPLMQQDPQMDALAEKMKPQLVNRDPLNQSLYIETKTRLPGWILWKSDRLSMAHSVEARVPFMDHQLVELAARIPPGLKLSGMDEKYILRKMMMPHMPDHPYHFKKRAFYTPIREWFFTKEKVAQLDCYMSKPAIDAVGCFDADQVQKYIKKIVAMAKPKTNNEYYRMMQIEWGLMVVLTVQIMHHLFIEKNAACFQDTVMR